VDDGAPVTVSYYLDGGNQSTGDYKTLTLAAVAGTDFQWHHFDDRWISNLAKHDAPFVHATDVVALEDEFSDWSKLRAHALLTDASDIIVEYMPRPREQWFHGILPITVTIHLADFRRALEVKRGLKTPEMVATSECVGLCLRWGKEWLRRDRFQFVFDRNERFYGHAKDRWQNKKSRRDDQIWKDVINMKESDMRSVPGLQAADLIAWSINAKHAYGIQFDWQRKLLRAHGEGQEYRYDRLIHPEESMLERINSWGLPPRRRYR